MRNPQINSKLKVLSKRQLGFLLSAKPAVCGWVRHEDVVGVGDENVVGGNVALSLRIN